MGEERTRRRVYECFARILEYPGSDLREAAREVRELVAATDRETSARLEAFVAFVERTPLQQVQEVYTGMFDLDAACHPYVGYHLFGDSYKRSVLLLGLKERCRARGIDPGVELPDHLAVVLRLLASVAKPGESRELIEDALLPALASMLRSEADGQPAGEGDPATTAEPEGGERRVLVYRRVLEALKAVLEREVAAGVPA